jgi:hypothetical protein
VAGGGLIQARLRQIVESKTTVGKASGNRYLEDIVDEELKAAGQKDNSEFVSRKVRVPRVAQIRGASQFNDSAVGIAGKVDVTPELVGSRDSSDTRDGESPVSRCSRRANGVVKIVSLVSLFPVDQEVVSSGVRGIAGTESDREADVVIVPVGPDANFRPQIGSHCIEVS